MVKARVSSRKPKSALDRERYTAELSTGQLVIGVCILLMFGLGCFLLGVLIGKFDPTNHEQVAGTTPEAGDLAMGDTAVPPEDSPIDPVSPVNNALPPEIRPPRTLDQPTAEPEPVTATPAQTPDTTAQTPSETAGGTPAQDVPGDAPRQPVSPTEQASAPPGSASASGDTNATRPASERDAEAPPAPSQSPLTPSPQAVKPPAPASEGIYGVQIIAVARPRAENVKRDIEARSPHKAQIIPIDGDRLCKVVVGRFSDERSALQARDEMRTKYAFRDAFVVSLR